jgi:uncharacterized protein
MKVRIDEIPPEGLILDLVEDGNRLFEKERYPRFEEKILSHIVLHPVGQSITLSGDLRARILLQCSRCLEEFKFPMDSDFNLEYRSVSEISDRGEIQLTADEMDVQYYKEGNIDLDEFIMGQVAEGIPFKPLCTDNCRGLCPQCGENLNQKSCVCVTESIDPRLAKLKDLLHKEDSD